MSDPQAAIRVSEAPEGENHSKQYDEKEETRKDNTPYEDWVQILTIPEI